MAVNVYALVTGLIVGILFGFVLQRGRFCMNSALRDPLVFKDFRLLKAVGLAIVVNMIGFSILHLTGVITMNPKPFAWAAQIPGGFIFGMGMVLAGGCASGTTYKTGEGMMGSFVALIGLAFGAYSTAKGVLLPIKTEAWTTSLGQVTLAGDATPIVMLIIGIIGLALYIWREILPAVKESENKSEESKKSIADLIFKTPYKWWVTAIAIGIIGSIAYITSAASGRNYPLGITAGWVGVLDYFNTGDDSKLGWLSWMVMGLVVGAFIAAKISGEYKLTTPKKGKVVLLSFIGGTMMGIGAVFSSGCNIGNLLSGVPQLSVGSIVVSIFIVLGCWFMAYMTLMRKKSE
jgi:uncharacterized membrane protein YedE/YeeE